MVQGLLQRVWLECAYAFCLPRHPIPASAAASSAHRVRRVSLSRQGRNYLVFGAIQYFVDWGVMVGLSHLGMPVEAANLAGRISGALLGFWLNGRFTFGGEDHRLGRRQFARFATMWIGTTIASTWAISVIDTHAGLQWTWMAKPVIEVILGGVGFLVSRYWVYRR